MTDRNWITIKTFSYLSDAAIIRSFLESEGIETFLQDEFVGSIYPAPDAIGGIKLQVKSSDLERTIELLKEKGFIQQSDLEPSSFQVKLYKLLSRIPFLKNIYK